MSLSVGLSPLPMVNTGLFARALNGSGSAPIQLDSLGLSPMEVIGSGQASLALTQAGEEAKPLGGHGYEANLLESTGRKPILIHPERVKPKIILSNQPLTVFVSEIKQPKFVLLNKI